MPGVPSSRGCDACRRQKKKCDEVHPACSRCARLKIPCVGSGQQRYKFQTVDMPVESPTATDRNRGLKARRPSPSELVPAAPPGNAQTMVITQLVAALAVVDPRFDLSVYGAFVREIPRRVGHNAILDAAAGSLAASLPLVHAGRPTAPMLHKYGIALQALRNGLSSRAQLSSLDTLCAIYLIVICEGWIRSASEQFLSHGEAVANILTATKGYIRPETAFEKDVLSTLCFLVIMESFINPRISLDADLWNLPEPHGPRTVTDEALAVDSITNRSLARTVALIRDPTTDRQELAATYAHVCADQARLGALLASLSPVRTAEGSSAATLPLEAHRLRLRWQTGYGILTLVAMRLNVVLQGMPAESGDPSAELLPAQLLAFVDNIIGVSEQAVQYRPLGSSAVPMFLLAAAMALEVGETVRRQRIKDVLSVYRPEFDLDQLLAKITPSFRAMAVCKAQEGAASAATETSSLEDSAMGEAENDERRLDMCCIL